MVDDDIVQFHFEVFLDEFTCLRDPVQGTVMEFVLEDPPTIPVMIAKFGSLALVICVSAAVRAHRKERANFFGNVFNKQSVTELCKLFSAPRAKIVSKHIA